MVSGREAELADELLTAVTIVQRERHRADGVAELAALLYANWYARPLGQPSSPRHFPHDLVAVLRAADTGERYWDDGWIVEAVSLDGRVVARRGSTVRLLDRPDYCGVRRPALLPVVGDRLLVTGRYDLVDPDGAWWRTASVEWQFFRAPERLLRVYWNFPLGELPELVRALTADLRGLGPWMLKCAADPAQHARPDATVLYVPLLAADGVAAVVDRVASRFSPRTRPTRPPMTLAVAAGVAAAVDPPGAESFGEHRCRLVVEAVLSAPGNGSDVRAVVEAYLGAAGIEVARLWAAREDPSLPWERTRP